MWDPGKILSYVDMTKSSRDPKLDLLIALHRVRSWSPFTTFQRKLSAQWWPTSGAHLTEGKKRRNPDTFFQGRRRREGRVVKKNKSELMRRRRRESKRTRQIQYLKQSATFKVSTLHNYPPSVSSLLPSVLKVS